MEVIVEEDACTGIDSGGGLIVNEITGDNLIFGVSEDTLHITLGGFLESTKNFFLCGGLFGSESQIHDGNIGGRDL